MKTYWISLSYATFGIQTNECNIVVNTAPIANWMKGKTILEIYAWVLKKKGIIKELK